MSESALERLGDGEVITVRPDGWVRGQLGHLEAIRDDLDHVLARGSCQSHLPGDLSALTFMDR